MATHRTLRHTLLSRDVAIAYAVIIVLYLMRGIRFQPLQIPAYLLIVAYDVVEVVLPFLTPYYPVGFLLFLYLLAIIGAGAARWLQSEGKNRPTVIRTVGGVCLVIGTISLLFGAYVGGPLIAPADNPTPLIITAATGIILLVTGWWLLDRPSIRERPSQSND